MTSTNNIARNIVNQLFDEAEVDVATRQRINDKCDAFVVNLLEHWLQEQQALYVQMIGRATRIAKEKLVVSPTAMPEDEE